MLISNLNQTRKDLAHLFIGKGVEVGVAKGEFSEIICQESPGVELTCIDTWAPYKGYRDHTNKAKLERFYQESLVRLSPYGCRFIRKLSSDALNDFTEGSLDFVYIDANHSYLHIYNDIRDWSRKVRRGGVISGHDYEQPRERYEVMQAVNDFVYNRDLDLFIYTRESPASWLFINP